MEYKPTIHCFCEFWRGSHQNDKSTMHVCIKGYSLICQRCFIHSFIQCFWWYVTLKISMSERLYEILPRLTNTMGELNLEIKCKWNGIFGLKQQNVRDFNMKKTQPKHRNSELSSPNRFKRRPLNHTPASPIIWSAMHVKNCQDKGENT